MRGLRGVIGKKFAKVLVVLLAIMSVCSIGGVQVKAATPSFGYMAGECTLYGNVKNQDYRAFTVRINNWVNGYKYSVETSNKNICYTSNLSVNSKSGAHFTVNALNVGTAKITLKMKNSAGKVIQSKSMTVTVTTKGMSAPTNLRRVSATTTTAKLNFKNATTTYVTGYRIQISTKSDFSNTVINQIVGNKNTVNITVNGLKKNTTYYARVAAVSTNGNKTYRSGWSNTVTFKTPKF